MMKYHADASPSRRCWHCGAGGAGAAKKYTFALVPKNMNNPFFDQARDGCKKAEKELNGAVECLYIGPGEHGGGDEQVQIVEGPDHQEGRRHRRLAGQRAGDGPRAAGRQEGRHPGADLGLRPARPQDKALRVAYVGTHNYEIGVNLAKLVHADQAEGRHDLHPVGRRRGGQPQRAHAGHPRHARPARRAPSRPAIG